MTHSRFHVVRPRRMLGLALVAACSVATACGTLRPAPAASATPQVASLPLYYPERDLGRLFHDVQLSGMFADSKTFVDARPLSDPREIAARYEKARGAAGFDLRTFVQQNFEIPKPVGGDFRTDTTQSMAEHIRALWPVLTRQPDVTDPRSSLIPLPNAYVVPGGRFREVYYWDSYFTMLGLVQSGRTDLVRDMLDNFAHLIGTVGHIPNGNRTYYLGRSQPPFFAAMVGLYAGATDTAQALRYLDAMKAEHDFWMDGADMLRPGQAYRRVVMMPEGVVLNRYWDDLPGPRPEAYKPDYEVAQTLPESLRADFYRNARATAESGWDFSSRWLRDPKDLRTLETTDLIPIDLNALLYNEERTIAAFSTFRHQPGDAEVAARFNQQAERRRQSLLSAAWDPSRAYFYDVRWRTWDRVTDRPTLAAASLLYFGLATQLQAMGVATALERHFLSPGGFVTTTERTGQQWDSPNGWAPLEWMAIEGVRRYGDTALANTARDRWLALNQRTYEATGRMVEKYDVVDINRPAGGGEYATQDGFGWTNGVALALMAQKRPDTTASVGGTFHPAWSRTADIYEVNIRQYTPEGTFAAFEKHLPRLKDLGVDILWLMPVQPIGKLNRKGTLGSYYSISNYLTTNPEFGTMADFRHLVNAAHALGVKVILDWVPNHTSFDNVWVARHPDYYVHNADGSIANARDDNNNVTDWTDVAELNYDNANMRRDMIAAMKWWVDSTGIDGFRDDVAGGVPYDFWADARRVLKADRPDLFLLAESERPPMHRYFDATYGWNFHHLLNDIAQGKQPTSALDAYFAWDDSAFVGDAYRMYFTSNHDENSWNGTEFERMGANHLPAYILAATVERSMPLLYTGQEVSNPKRLRFFEKDTVNWSGPSLAAFYRAVFALKHSQPALENGSMGGPQVTLHATAGGRTYAFSRTHGDNTVVVAVNFGDAPATLGYSGFSQPGAYTDWFSKASESLGASGSMAVPAHGYRVFVSR